MFKLAVAAAIGLGMGQVAAAQSEAQEGRATQFLPIEHEPPPELLVDPPLPGPLARGAVIIRYLIEPVIASRVGGSNASRT